MTKSWWGAIGLASMLLSAGADAAERQACPASQTPWVRVTFEGRTLSAAVRAVVLRQIGADLAEHGIAACEASNDDAPALGEVRIALSERSVLSIDLSDDVTRKRVARLLSLATIPVDARGLSIALATEELLHASWIEAALSPPPAPVPTVVTEPVPPAIVATNEAVVDQIRRAPLVFASVVAAADHATGGATGLGGDARIVWGDRAAFGVRVGARGSPDTSSEHGTVHEQQLIVGISAAYALFPRLARWGTEAVVRLDAVGVQLSGAPLPGAQGASGAALGVVLSGGLGAWLRLTGELRLVAEALIGGVLRGVTARDTGAPATGLTGVDTGAALGIAVGF